MEVFRLFILWSVSTFELATFEKLRKIIYISEDDEEATDIFFQRE